MSDQPLSPPSYAPVQTPAIVVPSQMRLHWIVVLIITGIVNKFLGGGIGSAIWMLLQARWVRSVTGANKAYNLSIASIAVFAVACVTGFFTGFSSTTATTSNASTAWSIMTIIFACVVILTLIVGCVLYIMAEFALRAELQAAPFGIKLSGPMTFFFGPVYFQYHLQKWGLPGEVGGPPVVAVPTPPPAPTVQS